MRQRSFLLAMSLVCTVGLGAGCNNTTQSVSPLSAPSSSSSTAATTPPTQTEMKAQLQSAIQAFNQAKYFHVKVTTNSPQGTIQGDIAVAKPNRFQGTIHFPTGETGDLIAIENSVYMRLNGQPWVNVSGTLRSKSIRNAFKQAINEKGGTDPFGVSSGEITTEEDTEHGCVNYITSLKQANGSFRNVQICVADGRPVRVEMTTDQGPAYFEYSNYNRVFLIERPL